MPRGPAGGTGRGPGAGRRCLGLRPRATTRRRVGTRCIPRLSTRFSARRISGASFTRRRIRALLAPRRRTRAKGIHHRLLRRGAKYHRAIRRSLTERGLAVRRRGLLRRSDVIHPDAALPCGREHIARHHRRGARRRGRALLRLHEMRRSQQQGQRNEANECVHRLHPSEGPHGTRRGGLRSPGD